MSQQMSPTEINGRIRGLTRACDSIRNDFVLESGRTALLEEAFAALQTENEALKKTNEALTKKVAAMEKTLSKRSAKS